MTAPALRATDLEAHWMPFTPNKAFKQAPRLLTSAKGVHYTNADGQPVLDGASGLWCVNAGHGREEIVQAMAEAARTLDYAPGGFQLGHPLGFEAAKRVAALAPGDLDHVFFTNSGSESVDTALKIALAYWQSVGQPERVRFVGRLKGYHGVGFGGISVGGIEPNRKAYARQLLPHVDHLPHTHELAENWFSRGQPQHGAHLADALEAVIAKHGGDTIAAVIVEPVSGSAGVLVPPVGYLERLRTICDAHGILLIFDEVITGFGRVGTTFAAERFGVTPDLMTIAKGLTNGTVPMGAVIARGKIYEAVVNAAASGIEFFHGYTYSAHPMACAAAIATMDIHAREGLAARSRSIEGHFEQAIHSLRGFPNVRDVRNFGLMGAVELEPREGKPGARGLDVLIDCFWKGALVRITGDTVAIAPPLVISKEQIDELVDILGAAIKRAT